MGNQRVRISVANLVSYLRNKDTGETVAIGIANKKLFEKEGKIRWQALGGAAMMTVRGKDDMEQAFGAEFLEVGSDAYDARFTIPDRYMKEVLGLFMCSPSEEFCESDPMREIIHELEQETFCGTTILPTGSLAEASSIFEGVFRQESAVDGRGSSSRAENHDVPTRRIFFVHTLCVPGEVFESILRHPCMKVLSENDLETTQMGRTKGSTGDDITMADNLCNWIPGYIT